MDEVELVRVMDADKSISQWELSWGYSDEEYTLTVSDPVSNRSWSARRPDVFDAFCEIRRQLEPEGIRICVSGARVDVYPSGMSREMGGGHMAYVYRKPNILRRLLLWIPSVAPYKLVYIFSPAPCDLVVSVDEQESYFDRWMNRETGFSR